MPGGGPGTAPVTVPLRPPTATPTGPVKTLTPPKAAPVQGEDVQNGLINYPVYTPGWDQSMSALDQLKGLDAQYSQGFNQMRGEALRKGPSNWLNMSRANAALHSQDAREKGALSMAGQTAGAVNALAAGGGLSSGARERVQEQGQRGRMGMDQDLARQDKLNSMNMGIQDEQDRVGKLGNLTNMESGKIKDWEQAKNTDTQNILAERKRMSDFQMDQYKSKMEAWAAERQARATENAGKK